MEKRLIGISINMFQFINSPMAEENAHPNLSIQWTTRGAAVFVTWVPQRKSLVDAPVNSYR